MKNLILSILMLLPIVTMSQEIIEDVKEEVVETVKKVDSTQRIKIDGVAAVIGDFVVLDSDIDKQFLQLEQSGVSTQDITRCQLFGKLLEDKLYIHHAIQDSLEVNDLEIRSNVDQQINAFSQQIGSMEKLIAYYNKETEDELRIELYDLNKNGQMINLMRQEIIKDIDVTPEEIRQFFNSIPENELPIFGTELKVAQIVVIPKTTEVEKQKVIDKLKEYKADVIDNGGSFTTKAVLYSDDIQSRKNGGKFTLNRKRPIMVKEFRAVAFSLQEGEISDPFESDFGYHIIFLEKIRGQEYDVRHILLRPKVTLQDIKEAKEKLELTRQRIVDGDISFADAAREVSDEQETKFEGGLLINPETQDYTFPLTKMDPELYSQIQDLKDQEITNVLKDDNDRLNPERFIILTVTDRKDEHVASFGSDYIKIKELALREKQIKAIEKWQEDKINDTFVKLNGEHRDCEFSSNWLKKQ